MPDNVSEWVRYAEEDWQVSVLLLRRKQPPLIAVTFHAQQSAEKYLKALLLSRGAAFPKTHDLPTLNTLCEQNGILTGFSVDDLSFLTDCAVTVRYPGAEPSLEEARQAVEVARAVRAFARRFLGVR
jgi:HEPN domain-containing protein